MKQITDLFFSGSRNHLKALTCIKFLERFCTKSLDEVPTISKANFIQKAIHPNARLLLVSAGAFRASPFFKSLLLLLSVVVMPPDHFEERAHKHTVSDTVSLRSFVSTSSTLPGSPSEELLVFGSHEPKNEATSQSQAPLHWRKTPLTRRGLAGLLVCIIKPIVLPSFFLQQYPPKPPRKLHSTSYLDGLRGVAALIVFIDHFSVHWFENIKSGYLATPEDTHLIQLPILRLIYSGRASVGVFFVISGFVLSYKPLLHIRSSQSSSVLQTLSGSVFRRSLRLYLPIVAGTFISAILACRGAYLTVPSRAETVPPQLPNFTLQYQDWLQTVYDLLYPFNFTNPNAPYSPPYNGHLYTIPIEFYGSMVVFTALLMLSHVRDIIRMLVIAWLAIWSLGKQRWDIFLFLSGTFLAELNFFINSSLTTELPFSNLAPDFTQHPCMRSLRIVYKVIFYLTHRTKPLLQTLLLILSLYLLSYPGDGTHPGIYNTFLLSWTPNAYTEIWYGPEHFYLSLGAPLLLLTLLLSPTLQRLFNYPLPQYLGDISYSLYIVHGMVLFTLGTSLMERWTGAIGTLSLNEDGTPVVVARVAEKNQYMKAFGTCMVINTVVAFWAADLFWRVVDRRSVRWARRVEEWVGK
jgi:peptidoglycan/LPS O-acetylase OafA/YrhL